MKVIAGNSNKPLAQAVSDVLNVPLIEALIKTYSDHEIFVEIQENVRGEDVFVIQPTSYPANDHVMELLLTIDALRRSSARRITAVIPYYGYSRQDRKSAPRSAIAAKLVANLITRAGADRVLTFDLHATQIQGFFDIPVDNLYAAPVLLKHILKNIGTKNIVCVAPDVGGVERARAIGKRLNAGLAIIDKRRERPGQSEVMNVIGEIKNKSCIIIDDLIDSGGTICNAADALIEKGAKEVYCYVVHGVLTGSCIDKIKKSKIKKIVITDTIDNTKKVKGVSKIEVVSIAPLIAEAIKRISQSTSVSSLFK